MLRTAMPIGLPLCLLVLLSGCERDDDSDDDAPRGAAVPAGKSERIEYAEPGADLQKRINMLEPGDTLVLRAGTYRTPALRVRVQGRADAWITIRAEKPGAVKLLSYKGDLFTLRGAKFLCFSGLEICGEKGARTKNAFKFFGVNTDIVVEDCETHHLGGGCINASGVQRIERLTVRRCHIHHTGGNGEGMYLGHQGGNGEVVDSLFEHNWIHDTGGDQGDGIEINEGGVGNVVRENVIYNCNYPCIYVENVGPGKPNVVEGNVCWGSNDNVIQVNGNAIVRNNIAFRGKRGALRLGPEPEGKPLPTGDVVIKCFNNTLSNDAAPAVVFDGRAKVLFANNLVDGSAAGVPPGSVTHNYFRAGGLGEAQIRGALELKPEDLKFFPRDGAFADAGFAADPDVPATDFDGRPRAGAPDLGAYEWHAKGKPAWRIKEAFKPSSPRETASR